MNPEERRLNHEAFRRMREWINQAHAPGRYLAISGGQIIADAAHFRELRTLLETRGMDPTQVLIVQAGMEYPETAVIFSQDNQE